MFGNNDAPIGRKDSMSKNVFWICLSDSRLAAVLIGFIPTCKHGEDAHICRQKPCFHSEFMCQFLLSATSGLQSKRKCLHWGKKKEKKAINHHRSKMLILVFLCYCRAASFHLSQEFVLFDSRVVFWDGRQASFFTVQSKKQMFLSNPG